MSSTKTMTHIAAKIAHRIRAIVIEETVPVVTGELRKSIHVTRHGQTYIIGTNKIYARAMHEGRKALIISPKNKKALRWKGAAHPCRKVFQPKREGKPFFRNAINKFLSNKESELENIAPDINRDIRDLLAHNLRTAGIKTIK